MKFRFIKIAALAVGILVVSLANAQKSNVVSAAVEYKKFDMAFYGGNMEEATSVLLNCKEYIDPAMTDESTKDDPKAHYYNGIIHFGLMIVSSAQPENEVLKQFQSEETKEIVEKSLKFAHDDRKYKAEVESYIDRWVNMMSMQGSMMFEKKEYDMAFAGFGGAYALRQMIDIEDEDMKNNALVSAKNAVITMKNEGKTKEALEFIESTQELLPDNPDLAIEGINLSFELGEFEKAESFIAAVVKVNPDDKQLFASIGRIFLTNADTQKKTLMEMDIYSPDYATQTSKVDELYAKAETNLKKALEIDPKYADAAYDLGVLYLGLGETMKERVRQLDYEDPNREELEKKSEELYAQAAVPLEIYVEQDPNNAAVLRVLYQVYYNAGNTEKALEYKKRSEEAGE
ncbi:MAG: tetratricopeptide repeat protein [Crocinitomicaceae bacterium]|nr:tetratricopeptide repeat protein [Crocinitomicaceae bacterium]